MGVSFSCPLGAYCDLDNGFESALVKSIVFSGDHNDCEEKNAYLQNLESNEKFPLIDSESEENMGGTESRVISNNSTPGLTQDMMAIVEVPALPSLNNCSSPKHEAAVKLQKVYKSFRTRRKLADCAVLIEQSWWKLLDFAELKHSSISFFDLDKHETAISRWSRARTRAAKVGKGLSKNAKAQKLALQHWLEAIDPRHRYGHNLHFYYMKWLHSQSKEPFFYWLDIGEGREVNLVDKCPRCKLQQQCIKYLGPIERKAYEVAVEDGKLLYQQTQELLDTSAEPKAKWIFVLSTTRTMYVGKKKKGTFQHSSFLAGGATLAAGRLVVEKGILKAVWPHSGHYRPTPENFQDFISFLKENNVDLSNVKLDSVDEEESTLGRASSGHMRSNSSEEDLAENLSASLEEVEEENDVTDSSSESIKRGDSSAAEDAEELPNSKSVRVFASKLTSLEIPNNDGLLQSLKSSQTESNSTPPDSPSDGYETAEEETTTRPPNTPVSSSLDAIEEVEENASEESILKRINSHSKGSKSVQLGEKLSCKWSTGAGPRIGYLRDYPTELQSHALEEANLSPRSSGNSNSLLLQRFSHISKAHCPSPLSPRRQYRDRN
ncbi:OLC1v1007670C1 [Oldenlandia corymbosa var. corymbosa]|uniref:OLC1v1007670C1 n=1 Tax=Oldenlandia corymbosa var. corymbosa TaxID=529605 RepID=A0AAV1DK01_OLDCO|nr:OLC1v1007670C1 [Oldenlandia corymbosa var. corymbosa]